MAAYFGICQQDKSSSYVLGVFRATMCYDSVIGSENTAVSVCMVGHAPRGPSDPPHEMRVGHSDQNCSIHYYLQVGTKI